MRSKIVSLGLIFGLLGAGGATAQPLDQAAASHDEVATVDEIVVVARRAGLPMWTVETASGSIILVGAISAVPRDYAWRPEALEAATARAQRILMYVRVRNTSASIGARRAPRRH